MARTAAIAGTATAVSRSVNRAANSRAQDKAAAEAYHAEQAQAHAPDPPPQQAPAAASGSDDVIEKLTQLGELHKSGVLSDEEFAAAKAKLLA